MFGLKKKSRKDERLKDWEALTDLLIGVGGGTQQADGSIRFEIAFKKEKRKAEVFVHCADVDGLGSVAYFTAPLAYPASPENCIQALGMVEKILEGGLVVASDSLALRTTKPLGCMSYKDVVRVIERLSVTADEFAKDFLGDDS
ncbi:MAG: hypothetical protein IKZ87_06890 [Actinomycetaceae bacterium]|nr:hypothetical protein [Actinomycetaceae bacterium]